MTPTGQVDIPPWLRDIDPELVVAAAIAVLIALLVVRWFLRRRRPPGIRFRDAIARQDSIVVLMHPNPDPDAMSCAIAVGFLAERVGTEASLKYPGRIQHQENRAFETVLDLSLDRFEGADELGPGEVVLVDHNKPRGFEDAESIDPYAVVDHHPGEGTGEVFTDVRPEYGACASIFAEYFEELGIEPIPPDSESEVGLPSAVATGLTYGIQSDTAQLTNGITTAEFDACEYLFPGVDEEKLDRIANPQVDAEVLDVKARAIHHREVEPPFAVADVGTVNNIDAIPQSADELIKLEGVTAVVVYGAKDGTVHLSGRSRDDRVHMGRILSTVAEGTPGGAAGGHARMGGGQIPYIESVSGGTGVEDLDDHLFAAMRGDL